MDAHDRRLSPPNPLTIELARRLRIPVRLRYRGQGERTLLDAEQQRLLTDLRAVDRTMSELASQRHHLARQAEHIHELLWPRMPEWHARRPAGPDTRPLPAVQVNAVVLRGARIRQVAVALLHRFGEQTLTELHAAIHLHGYVLPGRQPVKVLADALAHEARAGRAVRRRRGVYAPGRVEGDASTAPPPVDPFEAEHPQRWWPDGPDAA